ncbi:MAG: CoA transferase [Alphaproteobacteria bacterium]|nr:MAG: CoA transferase [Alphaproteobacteria bacterium]
MLAIQDILADLWRLGGGDARALARVTIEGDEPVLPSPFRCEAAAAASIASVGLAAAELWRLRTGRPQSVSLSLTGAAMAFRSERYLTLNNAAPPDPWSATSGFYETRDGRWIQLHTNFPHHRDGVLAVLGAEDSRDAVAQAIKAEWDGAVLDQRLAEAGLCAALVRSPAEWAALPQAAALADIPVVRVEKIGDAPPQPMPVAARPLDGVRVLDLSRIIAGPVGSRALAEHGADVLLVTSPTLPFIPTLVMDTGRGKRSTHIDLETEAGRQALTALVRESDIFLQAYRPGSLARRGFGAEALAALRPGIVAVSLSAYGDVGPWAERRGFDSLVQSASGIAWEGQQAFGTPGPKHLPCQVLDHATGYLAAFGAIEALRRRATEGGSWHVRVALAATGRWFTGLGRLADYRVSEPTPAQVAPWLETSETPFGTLSAVGPVLQMGVTPPRLDRPSVPLGTDPPQW